MFDQDFVDLLKRDGTRTEKIRSTVAGAELIVIKGNALVIDVGDLILRKLSNGAEETYEVQDPRFYERGPDGAHYQLKVKKLGLPEAGRAKQVIYNVTGNNARVNINSTDNSTNHVSLQSESAEQFALILEKIRASGLSESEKAEAIEVTEAAKDQFTSGAPKRSIVRSLLGSLPAALHVGASVAAILSAFP